MLLLKDFFPLLSPFLKWNHDSVANDCDKSVIFIKKFSDKHSFLIINLQSMGPGICVLIWKCQLHPVFICLLQPVDLCNLERNISFPLVVARPSGKHVSPRPTAGVHRCLHEEALIKMHCSKMYYFKTTLKYTVSVSKYTHDVFTQQHDHLSPKLSAITGYTVTAFSLPYTSRQPPSQTFFLCEFYHSRHLI